MASTADAPSVDANADARGKRPVWNVPPNGSVEVSPVMDAISWPALSEATKASPKSSSSESLKSLSDGSSSAPLLQVPLAAIPSSKQNIINPSPNPIPNAHSPVRQKSMKRGGGGGAPSNGAAVTPPTISMEMSQTPEPSPRGPPGKHNEHGPKSGGGMSLQSHGSDQHRGYGGGGGRRGNNGGGAHQQNNYGSRRNQDWSHQHNFYMQQQQQRGGVRPYLRAPAPYVGGPPSPVRSYVANPMGFPEMSSPIVYVAPHLAPEALRGVSPFAAPPPIYFPALDPQRAQLLKQIDYYFSAANLCKDLYLRKKMDEQGWVPITVIAGFNRVMQLTNNLQYILETVRLSTIVEVQGEKIRKRNDWMQWLLPPTSASGSGSPALTTEDHDAVAAHLQAVGIDGMAAQHNKMGGPIPTDPVLTRSASVNLNSQIQVAGNPTGEGNGQFTGFIDTAPSKSIRSLARSDTL
ncbi:la-related protein 1C isoform X1 [Iris pallida]|uniref:La-related protein 1C isoform X1 n=1 Tax=Iris pallida TaxID=29817 RepID=A0AAX6GML9_IRIPA|nr:la-related protein 1C isoform X1 [Iris pallida]KAJ6830131.1 la-related protein 1C isoform X1 [Iris pallida]